jgi:predicted nucleic acid-binding protein
MGRGDPADEDGAGGEAPLNAFVDTNILVRHLTGDPPEIAARATAYLASEIELLLTDLVAAETVYVLESFYEAPRAEVAEALRSLVAFGSIVCVDRSLLLRAAEVYETDRIDFAEAYLVACAESTGVGRIASFDRSLDRVHTIERVEPPKRPAAR